MLGLLTEPLSVHSPSVSFFIGASVSEPPLHNIELVDSTDALSRYILDVRARVRSLLLRMRGATRKRSRPDCTYLIFAGTGLAIALLSLCVVSFV